ncbi:MAG: SLC13 family permease [Candidatus Aenigmatarchaeota archaeon]
MKKVWFYILISFLAGIITYYLPLGIPDQAHIVLSILITVGALWFTEAIPLHATALLIPFLIVLFTDTSVKDVFAPFFDPVVILLMGGFTLAYGLRKFHLDEEIAYYFVNKIGTSPRKFLLAIMFVAAFLSMWMSNSATTAIMIPIVLVVLSTSGLKHLESSYAKSAVLGVAYAATIGGLATIVGTTPNAIAVKFLADQGVNISFTGWMYHALPLVIFLLPITWLVLTLMYKPEIKELKVRKHVSHLTKSQKKTLAIFFITVILWLTTSIHGVSSFMVALIPILLFYFLKMFDVKDFGRIHWDILILVGGGLSLGSAIISSGLNSVIASAMQGVITGNPLFIMLFIVSIFCIIFTLVSSNTGTASFVIPIIIPLAMALGIDIRILAILAGIAVSLDFMVPVGTPPNAIAYSTRYVRLRDMVKSGIVIAIIGALLLSGFAFLYW